MAEFYANLGDEIGLEEIITAEDMNEIVTALGKEMARRGKASSAVAVNKEDVADDVLRDAIRSDLVSLSYDGTGNPVREKMSAAEMQDYISYLRTLYGIKLTK